MSFKVERLVRFQRAFISFKALASDSSGVAGNKEAEETFKGVPTKKKPTPKALQFQDALFTLQGSVVVSLLMFEQASSGAAASVLADCTKGHSTIVIYDQ